MSQNVNLRAAKRAKKDEFYTQLRDIENEVRHYKDHFRGKVVYCNCDDPRVSNFFDFFSKQFEFYGLKKLITTCYKNQQPDLFSTHDSERAVYLEYEGDQDGNARPDLHEIAVKPLQGDGDFRSMECIELLKQADIVVTNPPFSLFREYVAQLMKYDKKFLIIGNMNAVTYKEMFPLIKQNKVWLGISPRGMDFLQPNGETNNVNAVWFTNLLHKKRNEELILYKKYSLEEYPHYDNYDAIEVSKTKDIPKNWGGGKWVFLLPSSTSTTHISLRYWEQRKVRVKGFLVDFGIPKVKWHNQLSMVRGFTNVFLFATNRFKSWTGFSTYWSGSFPSSGSFNFYW